MVHSYNLDWEKCKSDTPPLPSSALREEKRSGVWEWESERENKVANHWDNYHIEAEISGYNLFL